MNVKLIVTAME